MDWTHVIISLNFLLDPFVRKDKFVPTQIYLFTEFSPDPCIRPHFPNTSAPCLSTSFSKSFPSRCSNNFWMSFWRYYFDHTMSSSFRFHHFFHCSFRPSILRLLHRLRMYQSTPNMMIAHGAVIWTIGQSSKGGLYSGYEVVIIPIIVSKYNPSRNVLEMLTPCCWRWLFFAITWHRTSMCEQDMKQQDMDSNAQPCGECELFRRWFGPGA